ncbi:MAG: porin [Planctomycetota bacterium]|jgi:hypothetical protein
MLKLCMPLLGVALTTSIGLADSDDSSDVRSLREEVAALRAELATVKRDQNENWMTEARAAQIRGLVADVLADADTRASLMQSGATAGHDGKFYLRSSDGNFLLNIGGQLQFRYVYNRQDVDGLDSDRWGFEARRTKLKFSGHVLDPSWKYLVQGAFDRDGGAFELEDFEIEKDLGNGWSVRFGQFKAPFMREELTSSSRQLAGDRSLVNERFNQDRSQGVELAWESDQLRLAGMYSDGFNTDNTQAIDADTEWALTGRVEFLGAGTWKQFRDFTSWADDEFGWMIGAAFHYESQEYGSGLPGFDGMVGSAKEERLTFTIDGSVEFGGANLYAAYVYNDLDKADLQQWGVVVQGGIFLVPDEWELFARYEYGDDDDVSPDDLSVITFGFNRYWAKHGLKWTTDFGYGLDAVSSAWDSSGAGWRDDPADEDGQIVIRSQFQLLF